MATTYSTILNYTLPSDVASITLGSGGQGTIPQTYTDLILVISGKVSGTATQNLKMQFNGISTGTPYAAARLLGVESGSPDSSTTTAQNYMFIGDVCDAPFAATISIPRYSTTNTNKTFISRVGTVKTGQTYYGMYMGNWNNNNTAITSITISHNAYNLSAGTKFSLYGILAA